MSPHHNSPSFLENLLLFVRARICTLHDIVIAPAPPRVELGDSQTRTVSSQHHSTVYSASTIGINGLTSRRVTYRRLYHYRLTLLTQTLLANSVYSATAHFYCIFRIIFLCSLSAFFSRDLLPFTNSPTYQKSYIRRCFQFASCSILRIRDLTLCR